MRCALLLIATACGAGGGTGADDDAGLAPAAKIELAAVRGRIDHLAFDAARGRLLVCALGNGSVEVVDVAAGRVVKSLANLDEPQGVAVLPERRQFAVATGGDGRLHVFDAESLAEVKTLDAGDDADNVRFDEKAGELWVGAGEGLALFDAKSWERVAVVRLDGHAESFQLEPDGARLFVNVPSARHVAVVDRSKRAVVATWPLDGAASNYPMALDAKAARLHVGCRSPARLLTFDVATGKIVARTPIAGDCDDLFVDPGRARLYAIGGEGEVTVLALAPRAGAAALERLGAVKTEPGARTGLLVPALERLFVAVPRHSGAAAELRLFATGGAAAEGGGK